MNLVKSLVSQSCRQLANITAFNLTTQKLFEKNGTAEIWSMYNKRLTQFYLPPTHEPILICTPSRRASPAHHPLAGTHCAYAQPGWLVAYRDKCHAPRIEPAYGHPSQY